MFHSAGIEAYINRVNAKCGVNGKTVDRKVYDNGYEPAILLAAARNAVTAFP